MANYEGEPLHGDRSAWNATDFPEEHSIGLQDSALQHHLPVPTQGDLAVGDGNPNWIALAIGAAGTILYSDGSDPAWVDPSAAGIDFDDLTGDCDLADLADYTRGDLIVGGAADWEDLAVGGAGAILKTDGTDVLWTTALVVDANERLTIPVATTTTEALILQTTDDNTTKKILEIQKSDDTVLASIGATGAVLFQNSVDSTTSLQILDADGGAPVFNVDTVNERVGFGTDTPLGVFHAADGSSGATINPDYDNFAIESSTHINIAIATPNNKAGAIGFHDPENRNAGLIRYDHSTNHMEFSTNTYERVTIDANGLVGIMETTPISQLHVQTRSAAHIGIIARGAASQSANLQEWQDSAGNVLSGVDERGILFSDGDTDADSLYMGSDAGRMAVTGVRNIGIGTRSMASAATTGYDNVGLGYQTLWKVTEGYRNMSIGAESQRSLTTGYGNMSMGYGTLFYLTEGKYNVAIGTSSLYTITTALRNVAIGNSAGQLLPTTSSYNTIIGSLAGTAAPDGAINNNVFIGDSAARALTGSPGNNTLVGTETGYNLGGSSNVFIGYKAGYFEEGANKLYVSNSNTPSSLIYGEFDNDVVRIHGDLTLADVDTLGAEVLNETDFATHAKWDTVNDFDDTGGNAAYVHSAGDGTLTQTAANMATALVGSTWYALTYTCSGYTNSSFTAKTITTGILDTALNIPITNGTHTIPLYTKATPGDFVISITSDGTCDVTFDDISLKPITGGDLTVLGTSHFGDKVSFTQTDGNEYIDSLADGYLDLGATTAVRLKPVTIAEDAIYFTQTDGNEKIDSANDGYMDYYATTGHRFNNNVAISDSATIPPLNITERAAEPSSPSAGDIYLDDGTNTSSGAPGWRRCVSTGPDVWEDIYAAAGTGYWSRNAGSGYTYTSNATDNVFINESANTNMTLGLTINQGANDDEILTLKSSDVAHGMTDTAEADTWGTFRKAQATSGGLSLHGYKDADGDAGYAIHLVGRLGEAADTTKSTGGIGVVNVRALITDGGTGTAAVGADGNLFTIQNSSTTRYIFDAEGEAQADDSWTSFSDTRLKSEIMPLRHGLKEILQIEPKEYIRRSGYNDDKNVLVLEDNPRYRIGVLAEEIEDIIPEAVRKPPDDQSFYRLDYNALVPVLINAIKELNAKLEVVQ